MTTGTKIGIIAGSALLLGVSGFLVYRRVVNVKMLKRLDEIYKNGEGKQGGSGDLTQVKGIQGGDYKNTAVKGEQLLTGQQQLDISKQIWDAKNYTMGMINKDAMAIGAFKEIKSKNQLSQVADFFNKLKQQDLYTFIQTFTDSGSQDFFTTYIKNLPEKVMA